MAWAADRWETPAPEIIQIESQTIEKLDEDRLYDAVCEHYIASDNPDDITLIVLFDGGHEKDHVPSVMCRVAKFAMFKNKNKIRQIYFVPFMASDSDDANLEIALDRIDNILDDLGNDPFYTIVNVSRHAFEYISAPRAYKDTEAIKVINRLEEFSFGNSKHPGVMTIPDGDVFKRNEFGKIGKENQMLVGEWVHALRAALNGNLFDIDSKGYTWKIIETETAWDKFLDELWASKFVAIDTETENLNRLDNRLACIQITCDGSKAYIIPFEHPDVDISPKLKKRFVADLKEYFERGESRYHIYANAKFDLIRLFVDLKLQWYNHAIADVQGAQYSLEENRKFRSNVKITHDKNKLDMMDPRKRTLSAFSLETLIIERGCTAYLNSSMGKEDRANIFGTPFKSVAEYGGLDAVLTWRLWFSQIKEAKHRGDDYDRFIRVVTGQINSIIRAFVKMELNGLPVDRAYLAKQQSSTSGEFEKARAAARAEMYEMESLKRANEILLEKEFGTSKDLFGQDGNWIFDIDKTEHQQILFFDALNLEPTKIGKNGQPSTDKTFKEKYAPKGDDGKYLETAIEEVKLFAQYGEYKHLFNSFVKSFYKKLFDSPDMRVDGRLRPTFKYLPIVTGRVGASDPSLQNVPSRSKLAPVVKRQFITKDGSIYIKVDFDSHETRNFAIAAGEPKLADAYIAKIGEKKKFRLKEIATEKDWKEFEEHLKSYDLHRMNCLSGDTLVQSDRGLLRMDDPRLEGSIVNTRFGPGKVEKHICNGIRKTFKLKAAGLTLRATADHQIPVFKKDEGRFVWTALKNIKAGDLILSKNNPEVHPKTQVLHLKKYIDVKDRVRSRTDAITLPEKMTDDLAYILGLFLGDGTVCRSKTYNGYVKGNGNSTYVGFHTNKLELAKKVQKIIKKIFNLDGKISKRGSVGDVHTISGVEAKRKSDYYDLRYNSTAFLYALEQLGLWNIKIRNKLPQHTAVIPDVIWDAPESCKIAFLAGYVESDGTISRTGIDISTSSPYIKNDLPILLSSLGIQADTNFNKSRSGRNLYKIRLTVGNSSRVDLNKFMLTKTVNCKKGYWHLPNDYWKSIMKDVPLGYYFNMTKNVEFNEKFAKISLLKNYLGETSPEALSRWDDIRDNGWVGVKVNEIEYYGEEPVYDLTIEKGKDPSFIANGIVVHNCRHFFGIPPEEVTKSQRSQVKTVSFGVLYGMSSTRLALTLGITEEEAQNLIDKFFEQFPDGQAYVNMIKKEGSRYLVCVSGIGRVRHMWGYLHTDRGVKSGMDRRSVNSMIQGIASDEGMEGNFQAQRLIWEYFHSQDIPLDLEICNSVHDSLENISAITTSPVACYLIEHAGSTLVHKVYRERYGVEFNVGLELTFDIGPSLGHMFEEWNYRPEQLEKFVRDSHEWSVKNLGHTPLTKRQWEAFRHNNDLIYNLRREELLDTPRNGLSEHMYLTKKIARQVALEY